MGARWMFLPLAALTSGCFLVLDFDEYSSFEPGPVTTTAEAGLIDTAISGSFALELSAPRVVLVPGASTEIVVTLKRDAGFDATVALSVAANGAVETNAAGQVLTKEQSTFKLTVTARADAVPGTSTALTVIGVAGNARSEARLDVDVRGAPGNVDSTFGDAGVVVTAPAAEATLFDMAIDAEDRILVGALGLGVQGSFVVARFGKDGALDPSFADGGVAAPAALATNTHADSLALEPDGGVAAAGTNGSVLSVARFSGDGTLDPSFGDQGIASIADEVLVTRVLRRPTGQHAIVGTRNGRQAIVQLLPTGALDVAFGTGGSAQFGKTTSIATVVDAERAADDSVVGVVSLFTGIAPEIGSFVFENNGGSRAPATLKSEGTGTPVQILLAPSGDRAVIGYSRGSGSAVGIPTSAIVAYHAPDGGSSTLGDNGKVEISFPERDTVAVAGAFDPQGRLVVMSTLTFPEMTDPTDPPKLLLARLLPDGTFDGSFGGTGKIVVSVGSTFVPVRLRIQHDGKLVVGGTASGSLVLARFWP